MSRPPNDCGEDQLRIRLARTSDRSDLVRLIEEFRATLAQLRGRPCPAGSEAASQELAEYLQKDFSIYVAESMGGTMTGYLVCRVDGGVIWAESLYVMPEWRRQGVGSRLYACAEKLGQDLGGDTVYNWVDPDNDAIISFLAARGYTVLNLIELRRRRSGEQARHRINVGPYRFVR